MAIGTKPKVEASLLDLTKDLTVKINKHYKLEESLKKAGLLALLTVQNALHVLAMRYIRVRPQEMFLSTVAVFFTELIKLVTCFLFILIEQRSITKSLRLLHKQIFLDPMDTLKVCVPALMYVVMSILMYTAVSNLAAATFMVTFQLKILSAAIFTVILLHRRLSLMQWISLPVLLAGIVLVQLDEKSAEEHARGVHQMDPHNETQLLGSEALSEGSSTPAAVLVHAHIVNQRPLIGLLAVLLICLLSGFAGVFLEKILKDKKQVSVWIRNIQLSAISLPVSIASIFIQDGAKVFERGLFVGFDLAVWITICLGAFGGLLVAVIIKYTDNILKAFATSFAVVLSCICSAVIFHFSPTVIFVVGGSLVVVAVCIYSSFPYKQKYQLALRPLSIVDEEKQKLQPV